jgi:hypothetical protein
VGFGYGRYGGGRFYYRPGYYGWYGTSPLYYNTCYNPLYVTSPAPLQVYLVPAEFAGAAPGTVIQYGGVSYVIGSNGTMTPS